MKQLLHELSLPGLFEHHPFRVLELPVGATTREVSRRSQFMEQALRNQMPPPPGPARYLPGSISDENAVRLAGHHLSDSRRRLIAELFWFWPLSGGPLAADDPLGIMADPDQDAVEAWTTIVNTSTDDRRTVAAWHNLAVMALYEALTPTSAALARPGQLASLWAVCWVWWRPLLDGGSALWDYLRLRIRDLDDPALKPGAAEGLRRALPAALFLIQVRCAMKHREAGRLEVFQALMTQARAQHLPGDAANALDEALNVIVSPARESLRVLGEAAEKDAQARKKEAGDILERFLDQAEDLLRDIDLLLPPGHPSRTHAHDTAALAGLTCQIAYGNETKDWKRSAGQLNQCLLLVEGDAARERIQGNVKIVNENVEFAQMNDTCWFCGGRPAAAADEMKLEMHGDINVEYTGFGLRKTWRHGEFKVPRCPHCHEAHDKASNGCLAFFGAALVSALAGIVTGSNTHEDTGLAVFIGCLIISIIFAVHIHRKQPKVDGKKRKKEEFPTIKELLGKGWQWGKEPPSN